MTEYLLFIHGVNTRETRDEKNYAAPLIEGIQHLCSPSTEMRMIELHWGDVNSQAEQELLTTVKASPLWDKLGFPNLRSKQLLQSAGDAALYISRVGGQSIVEQLLNDARRGLQDFQPGRDHLHLIAHSLGTVILFDLLFSSRWDAANAGGYHGVEEFRNLIFRGEVPVRSIHTMGSPLGIFSLMTSTLASRTASIPATHDITPRLREYFQTLFQHSEGIFRWRNYLHPMDPVVAPIEHLLPQMLDVTDSRLDVKDILTENPDFLADLSSLAVPFLEKLEKYRDQIQLMVLGGPAHDSYWSSPLVASSIVQSIEMTAHVPELARARS